MRRRGVRGLVKHGGGKKGNKEKRQRCHRMSPYQLQNTLNRSLMQSYMWYKGVSTEQSRFPSLELL